MVGTQFVLTLRFFGTKILDYTDFFLLIKYLSSERIIY